MYFVYVLKSELDGSFYIGFSQNKDVRLLEHNFGRTGYTKKKRPWVMVYHEMYSTASEAIKRERYLKNLKSKKYLSKLVEKNLAV